MANQWRSSFSTFFNDMGPAPSPTHSVDRIDVNGNYTPSNCRWATHTEQMRNRRTTKVNLRVVSRIKAMTEAGMSQYEIAEIVKLNQCHVSRILSGKRWAA